MIAFKLSVNGVVICRCAMRTMVPSSGLIHHYDYSGWLLIHHCARFLLPTHNSTLYFTLNVELHY